MFSWTHPKLEKKFTPDRGVGTFVREPVKKDEIVVVTGGRIKPNAAISDPSYAALSHHAFQIDRGFHICPAGDSPSGIEGIFAVNHSCAPTCGIRGQLSLVALRDLKPGEEITYDYAMTDADNEDITCDEMKCLCGFPACRGTVTGKDWKNPALQKKYAGYFSMYVQELISAGKGT